MNNQLSDFGDWLSLVIESSAFLLSFRLYDDSFWTYSSLRFGDAQKLIIATTTIRGTEWPLEIQVSCI